MRLFSRFSQQFDGLDARAACASLRDELRTAAERLSPEAVRAHRNCFCEHPRVCKNATSQGDFDEFSPRTETGPDREAAGCRRVLYSVGPVSAAFHAADDRLLAQTAGVPRIMRCISQADG